MIDDFVLSGLVTRAAEHYRVIAIDRPGYGRSSRPRDRLWTPGAQADLIHRALRRLDVYCPVMFGHSFGATVALAYALRYPVERSATSCATRCHRSWDARSGRYGCG